MMTILWHSIIGSHLWGTNNAESDIDIAQVYVAPLSDILVGKQFKGKFNIQSTKEEIGVSFPGVEGTHVELTTIELGHLVELLKKGNINMLWFVMSTRQETYSVIGSKIMKELRAITMNNYSTRTYHSVKGMAKKAIASGSKKEDSEYFHRVHMVNRSLEQLRVLFMTGKLSFDIHVTKNPLLTQELVDKIDNIIENKMYVIKDDVDVSAFDRFLYKTRMRLATVDDLKYTSEEKWND
jgi:predicted nucleotidyltransferase